MDDVWGNAWSAAGSSNDTEVKQSLPNAPKWNAFERDADDDTVDVGASSWKPDPGLGWGGTDSNMWHAESSTPDAWAPGVTHREPDAEQEESEATLGNEETEDDKGLEPRPILPTPPQSPLLSPSSLPVPSPEVEEIPPSSPAPVQARHGSPDPFGSFESAEAAPAEFSQGLSWGLKSPGLPAEATDEPWGGAWGSKDEEEAGKQNEGSVKDEWELAQEAKRKQERKVPPQLLASLVAEWEKYADDISSSNESDDTGVQSWRKGLDNVEGLTDLVDSLAPVASFPPVRFSKSAVSRAFNESLRLTRSLALTRSSPMAHLYASKGSTDWERSIKAQKAAANDEWGWDLKHEPEEKHDPTESAKEKKGGLLSFWSKKTSPSLASDTNAPNRQKSPTVAVKPASPASSARPSSEVTPNTSSPAVVSPTSILTPPVTSMTASPEPVASDGTAQPSVVSRFFNRFSRKAAVSPTLSEKGNHGSLVLSEDDLSILSEMVPSASGISTASGSGSTSLLHNAHDSAGSLEAMLTSQSLQTRSSSKLPPPLAPPPAASRIVGPASAKSTSSDSSFDAKMADLQLLDILENMGQLSSGPGYAPVSSDLIDSPKESSALPSKLRSPVVSSVAQEPSLSPVRPQVASRWPPAFTNAIPVLPPPLPPPLHPPTTPPRAEARFSGILAPTTPPPPSPLRHSFNSQRYDNPLPPAPQSDADDFSEFLSASKSPSGPSASSTNPALFPTRQPLPAQSTSTYNSVDFGDFGDFISSPVESPSPPKVTHITPRVTQHKQTVELVKKAASMSGQWPAPPSPLPQPLSPPPSKGFLAMSSTQQRQQDLLGDDSPLKSPPAFSGLTSPALPKPLFASSHPTSTPIPGLASPSASTLTPRSGTTSLFDTVPTKPPSKSGLSAQDLSFFEGL